MKEIDKLKEILQSLEAFRDEYCSCDNTINACKYLSMAIDERNTLVSRVSVTLEYLVDVKHKYSLDECSVQEIAIEYVRTEYPYEDTFDSCVIDHRHDDLDVYDVEDE